MYKDDEIRTVGVVAGWWSPDVKVAHHNTGRINKRRAETDDVVEMK